MCNTCTSSYIEKISPYANSDHLVTIVYLFNIARFRYVRTKMSPHYYSVYMPFSTLCPFHCVVQFICVSLQEQELITGNTVIPILVASVEEMVMKQQLHDLTRPNVILHTGTDACVDDRQCSMLGVRQFFSSQCTRMKFAFFSTPFITQCVGINEIPCTFLRQIQYQVTSLIPGNKIWLCCRILACDFIWNGGHTCVMARCKESMAILMISGQKIAFASIPVLYDTPNRVLEYEIHSLGTDVGVKKTLSPVAC